MEFRLYVNELGVALATAGTGCLDGPNGAPTIRRSGATAHSAGSAPSSVVEPYMKGWPSLDSSCPSRCDLIMCTVTTIGIPMKINATRMPTGHGQNRFPNSLQTGV